jgi:predicted O-methyltransferase YrrM
MDHLFHPQLEAYGAAYTSPLNALLTEVESYTRSQHPHAHMISGAWQGQFLRQLSLLLQPRYILEVGTFTGFSALCLVDGLPANGELHTIELREADAQVAQGFFQQAARSDQLHLHVGPALSIIPGLAFAWDLVFLDADKTGYIDYYELILPRMKSGACLLADNVLFHGQVLEDPVRGKNASAVAAFNAHVQQDDRVEQVLLPLRDGLLFIRKK